MRKFKAYLPKIADCDATRQEFSADYEAALQDYKRLKALQAHYRTTSKHRLPLEYGHVLILFQMLRKRFLFQPEKDLIKMLCENEKIDYTLLCYKKYEKRRGLFERPKDKQLDMFPELYTYYFPNSLTFFEVKEKGRTNALPIFKPQKFKQHSFL